MIRDIDVRFWLNEVFLCEPGCYGTGSGSDPMLNSTCTSGRRALLKNANMIECGIRSLPLPVLYQVPALRAAVQN